MFKALFVVTAGALEAVSEEDATWGGEAAGEPGWRKYWWAPGVWSGRDATSGVWNPGRPWRRGDFVLFSNWTRKA